MFRDVKDNLELNLAKDVKVNRKGFSKSNKRKIKENRGPLLNGAEALLTKDIENAEILNTFFTSVFTSKNSLQKSQGLETRV